MKEKLIKLRNNSLQKIANNIIESLNNSKNDFEITFWYEKGAYLNAFTIINFDLYLD